ncbi:MAG: Eco57I restriction-modification methylase domain-containing protein [Phycisphaerales bacterium]|nr:Eco57I restriction-modification methylase domain-containing protein [Planctomycetota bacterium]MCH8507654.1 Eco57I restriction-modification methylase domain-containing protein [Phycisphaerales bacterium]
MSMQANFTLRGRNPDVLTCIANLSNDEVFTPPEFANRMLDTLAEAWAADNKGADIWADKTVRFLDPCTKSGVFLREITSRLTKGLERQIPNLEKRVNHILTKQVFGIATTHLTSLLARRSLYCSKHALGEHSITKSFADDDGNVWFKRIEHTWGETKCEFCEAPKAILDRGDNTENYAYAFIHSGDIKARCVELFGDAMQFDVVIGNPPYQMKGGAGGSSDSSIYHLFVQQAMKLEPRYLSMVIPSRWLAGGRGLDDFRKAMLGCKQLRRLVDFPVSREVFPNVEVKGGICYFLWSAEHAGECDVTVIRGKEETTSTRQLDEFEVFVRDPRAIGILRKVLAAGDKPVTNILTADTPFGLATNFDGFDDKKKSGSVALHYVRGGRRDVGFVQRSTITKNANLIDKWKVLVPKAGSDGGQKIPDSVLGKPWISRPPSVATQTFLAFCVETEDEARSVQSYYCTKFFRHLVSLRKLTQDALRPMYGWVPMQSWNRSWTDAALYKKYKLTKEEIDYVETVIRPMDLTTEADDE